MENRSEDVFFDDYYLNPPEFKWKYDYRQLRRASELMYVNICLSVCLISICMMLGFHGLHTGGAIIANLHLDQVLVGPIGNGPQEPHSKGNRAR